MNDIARATSEYVVLLDANDEEIGRGPASHRRAEGPGRFDQLIYTGRVEMTTAMRDRSIVRTRVVTPLFTITKEISPTRLSGLLGDTITVIQPVEIGYDSDPHSATARPWWRFWR